MSATIISPLNARVSAVALFTGASLQLAASRLGMLAAPWAYLAWLVFLFGGIGLCQELGASKPLNRAGLLFLAASLCARTVMVVSPDHATQIRTELLSAFTSLAAILFWSVALMHRSDRPQIVGALGTILSGSALLLLFVSHLAVGAIAIFGFSDIFGALHDPGRDTRQAMETLATILAVWSIVIAHLLWTRKLDALQSPLSAASAH